ncbi:MAG: XdhC family protein [Deltaproteobacteria bacterium]
MFDLDPEHLHIAAEKLKAGEEMAIITVLSTTGGQAWRPGTMMILDQYGESIGGSIAEGSLREIIRQEALRCMSRGVSRQFSLGIEAGIIEIFIKVITNKEQLIIVGSGSLVQDIYHIACILGYHIIIVDSHPETLNRERFPLAAELLLGDVAEQLNTCTIDDKTSIIITSHHHEADQPALLAVVESPARYIGVLGNKRKVTAHFSKLNDLGIAENLIERVHVPIGLDLGGQKTAEIALAVMAEIQAVKYGRQGGFLTIKHIKKGIERREELF